VPVEVGGLHVEQGDWIVGDDDGVVVIPRAKAVEIANRAVERLEMENRVRAEIKSGSTLGQVMDLYKWEKK
jgi:3-hexulose-6-phosphate synthase/6-phospho-3-hexuloisomerase